MKKIAYSLFLLVALSFVYSSCSDDSLDPLQVNNIKKGKLLALRGAALTNVYSKGIPASEFFPRIATATDKITFEAEYLAEDPKTLQSVDFFVLKKVGTTTTRELVKNVPFSSFVNDGKYKNPWVTVTLTLPEILTKLGLSTTFPLDNATVTTLLTTYKFGVSIEGDLNLTDGSKALAANVVAAGLFQSDQFYPAQKLTYGVTDFCSYDAAAWVGSFEANEIYSNGVYGPYNVNLSADGAVANRFNISNFYDSGITAFIDISPSTSAGPSTQTAKFPDQTSGGKPITKGAGTYDQCLGTLRLTLNYDGADWTYSLKKNP
jgi:hypothetical protein